MYRTIYAIPLNYELSLSNYPRSPDFHTSYSTYLFILEPCVGCNNGIDLNIKLQFRYTKDENSHAYNV